MGNAPTGASVLDVNLRQMLDEMEDETLEEAMITLEERGVISEEDAVYTVTEA